VVFLGVVAQTKALYDISAKAPLFEIGQSYGLPFIGIQEHIVKIAGGVFVKNAQTFLGALLFFLLGGALGFYQFYLVIVRQPMYGLGVGELFVLLHKSDYVAALAATKAFINALGGRYVERRSFLVVKRAIGNVAGAALLQPYKLP